MCYWLNCALYLRRMASLSLCRAMRQKQGKQHELQNATATQCRWKQQQQVEDLTFGADAITPWQWDATMNIVASACHDKYFIESWWPPFSSPEQIFFHSSRDLWFPDVTYLDSLRLSSFPIKSFISAVSFLQHRWFELTFIDPSASFPTTPLTLYKTTYSFINDLYCNRPCNRAVLSTLLGVAIVCRQKFRTPRELVGCGSRHSAA